MSRYLFHVAILLALATLAGGLPAQYPDLPQIRAQASATVSVRLVSATQIRNGASTSSPEEYQQRETRVDSPAGARPAVLFEFY